MNYYIRAAAVHGQSEVFRLQKEIAEKRQVEAPPLDLTHSHNRHKTGKAKRYGLKGISRRGRRVTRGAVELLEERHGKEHLSFLTLTVSDAQHDALDIKGYRKALKTFLQALKRRLADAGLPTAYIYALELQKKRLEATGRVGLHAHIVFVGRHPKSRWAVPTSFLNAKWAESIERVTGIVCDRQRRYGTNVQGIKHSAGAYLAKYVSKGVGMDVTALDDTQLEMIPTQWWGCEREWLREWTSESIMVRGKDADLLLELLEETELYLTCYSGQRPLFTMQREDGSEYQSAGGICRTWRFNDTHTWREMSWLFRKRLELRHLPIHAFLTLYMPNGYIKIPRLQG